MEPQSASVTVHQKPRPSSSPATNALPSLLQTPAGLALLELQGTINLPEAAGLGALAQQQQQHAHKEAPIPIGRLDFPDYDATADASSTAWMKRVHLYVGPHQRLTGEVKKLPKAMAVVRRQLSADSSTSTASEDLEVVEIVHYKLLFSQRPEPMTKSS